MAGPRIDGLSLGMIAAGGVLTYAGVRGKSVPGALTALIQGQSPATAPKAAPIQQIVQVTQTGPATGPGLVQAAPTPTSSEDSWIRSFLAAVSAPATPANISSMSAWISHEAPWNSSPPDGALYTNNPLNTTQPNSDSIGAINSVGVQRFRTLSGGLNANATVLLNGRYGDILMLLRSGQGLCGHSLQGLSTWSGGGYSSVC